MAHDACYNDDMHKFVIIGLVSCFVYFGLSLYGSQGAAVFAVLGLAVALPVLLSGSNKTS